jgi:8-amino-3,8-dideoxy-alpha-D-manno-octulosonate transaminase
MPGWELIDNKERNEINNIFDKSNGVMFAHGFDDRRNNIFRVREFEKRFAKRFGVKHCLATTSGTMAQYIAMKAMGIGPGDEVITQAFTFVATVETIVQLGATPILIESDETFNMDLDKLEEKINENTKLVIPVQMLGNQVDTDKLKSITSKYNIPIMEDACEALGASFKNSMVGSHGDVGIFSLDFAKTITTGEGGIIITNDDAIAKYIREFHDHGHESNPEVPRGRDTRSIMGLNLRMSELQAAVGLAQLEKLDYIVERNRHNKSLLKSLIINNENIKFRKIVEESGELADTLIFYFNSNKEAQDFVEKYNSAGYFTKNLPDAIDWHFAGTWNHMFVNDKNYKDTWSTEWPITDDLLRRSISIPILVTHKDEDIIAQSEIINSILRSL